MSDFLIMPVSPAAFDMRWDEVEPMLDKALPVALGRYEARDVLQLMIRDQSFQGWFILHGGALRAVAVTQVIQFPRRRCLTAFLLSGRGMSEWFSDWYGAVEDYALRAGCDHMEAHGRPAWQKILDLEPRATFLVKELAPKVEALMN